LIRRLQDVGPPRLHGSLIKTFCSRFLSGSSVEAMIRIEEQKYLPINNNLR
jgi:hypothetical protein